MNGSFSNWVYVTNAPGYNVVGVGDINDDHYADIVIQNSTTGAISLRQHGTMASSITWVGLPSTPGWNVVAVADINDDGYADIVIQNNS